MHAPGTTRLTLLLTLAVAGCATAPPPVPAAPFRLSADHFAGTVLTGALPGEPATPEVPALDARLRVSFCGAGPGTSAPALARQVFLAAGGETLRPHSESMSGLRQLPSGEFVPHPDWTAERREALLPGTAVSWHLHRNLDSLPPSLVTWDSFEVQVSRSADAPEHALEAALVFGDEHLVLAQQPTVDGESLWFLVPAPNEELAEAALVLELSLRTPPEVDEVFAQSVERAQSNLAGARARARDLSTDLSDSESFQFEVEGALRALSDDSLRRPALVFLARETHATFTGDLALTCDDATFAALLGVLREHLDEFRTADSTASPATIGWFLDATAYAWIAEVAAAPETELAPELHALLLIHTGQLARYPDLVHEVAGSSASLAQFDERLLAENRIFLEDAHPAARVRALAWLRQRDAAPRDFDPLGSRTERRAALASDGQQAGEVDQ